MMAFKKSLKCKSQDLNNSSVEKCSNATSRVRIQIKICVCFSPVLFQNCTKLQVNAGEADRETKTRDRFVEFVVR